MAMKNRLGGHTNSYHGYSLEEALEGIAGAGYRYVELSAVRGWTEHVPLEADGATLSRIQRLLNRTGLVPCSLSGHSDLTTAAGLEDGLKALDLCSRMGIDIMNTAIGGHYSENEDEAAFMGNIGALADAAAARDIVLGIEIHGDITATGKMSIPILEKIGRPNVRINYDTANIEFYGATKAVDDIPLSVSHIVHCHLKDKRGEGRLWDFPAVGDGHVDFKRVLELFAQGGYTGPFTVEIEFQGEPFPPVPEINAAMKRSYDTLAALGLS